MNPLLLVRSLQNPAMPKDAVAVDYSNVEDRRGEPEWRGTLRALWSRVKRAAKETDDTVADALDPKPRAAMNPLLLMRALQNRGMPQQAPLQQQQQEPPAMAAQRMPMPAGPMPVGRLPTGQPFANASGMGQMPPVQPGPPMQQQFNPQMLLRALMRR